MAVMILHPPTRYGERNGESTTASIDCDLAEAYDRPVMQRRVFFVALTIGETSWDIDSSRLCNHARRAFRNIPTFISVFRRETRHW